MKLEHRVGQLLIVGLPGTQLDLMTRGMLETIQPGGVLLMGHNIESAQQVVELTSSIRSLLQVPPLIAVDQEGGRVDRLKNIFSPMPSADLLRASGDAAIAARLGEITAEGLRLVARAAEEAGITLVLELLNSKVDHKDYQCDRTDWGVRVIQMVDSPRVKLLYDIYHMQIMEGDIIRTIRDSHAHIGHYHTAGNPGRNEIDDTQELNYPAIVRAIAATGYAGYLGQEFVPKGDPVAALRDALARCQVTSDE
jgi:hypothetical protein